MEKHVKISRVISMILRHKPEMIDAVADEHGWVDTNELITGVKRLKPESEFDLKILEEIVTTDSKQRYTFNDNKTKIRANQGHSFPVDLGKEPVEPPSVLYHGTATKSWDSIRKEGLKPMSRQYVHLSADVVTAFTVGTRHGQPIVLEIDTVKMYKDGFEFIQADNGVWLTKEVPEKYIRMAGNS